ncbi:MAG: 16S rRNA (guanine1516-N2)-methyltransferase [Phenylobacterium sp.]|jgi:16S rRNA (guanine1516-N2)-methyltransferase
MNPDNTGIALVVTDPTLHQQAEQLCQQYGFVLCDDAQRQGEGCELLLDHSGLQLLNRDEPKQKAIMVDFVAGANAHRRKFGGGKGQSIAKAVGIKGGYRPKVIDGTAGLGKDAFVLASLGCQVTLVERHPVVSALLADGLARAYQDPDIGEWMQQRLILSPADHISELVAEAGDELSQVDVVYLDPMYPHREKSALVKKDMRTFQSLVGADTDADHLFAPAMQLAQKRVVVKRPDYATPLAGQAPTMVIETKKNRFDVYVTSISSVLPTIK